MAYESPEVIEVGAAEDLILSYQYGSNCDCGGKKAISSSITADDFDDDNVK